MTKEKVMCKRGLHGEKKTYLKGRYETNTDSIIDAIERGVRNIRQR